MRGRPDAAPRFRSILFERPEDAARTDHIDEPSFFADLNLDQLVAAVTVGREEYQLRPFFYVPLHDGEAVRYRHDILRDLEKEPVLAAVQAFAGQMRQMREQLVQAGKLHYRYQQERWFLDAVASYCAAVSTLPVSTCSRGDSVRSASTSPITPRPAASPRWYPLLACGTATSPR